MRKILAIIFLFLSINTSPAQCIADAGSDKVVCNFFQGLPTVTIGGNPSAIAGIPPFTYTWETVYVDSVGQFSTTYHASDFLDDTTIANPAFIFIAGDSLNFILTVTDGTNNVCKDTVFIRISHFGMHLGTLGFTIQQGDSVFLDYGTNIWSSNLPLNVLWQPTHGLTDSTSLSFWAKPDYSISYHSVITDALGCSAQGSPFYFITVIPVSVDENENFIKYKVFPNPFSDKIYISKSYKDNLTFYLFNAEVKLLLTKNLDINEEEIKLDFNLPAGFYFYRIVDEMGDSASGKLVKYPKY